MPQVATAAIQTSRGGVEITDTGEGPAVLTLHGAMGGHDQSELLAETIGPRGHRYVNVSRPGYLGTPLASGPSPEAQADLLAALLDALGPLPVPRPVELPHDERRHGGCLSTFGGYLDRYQIERERGG